MNSCPTSELKGQRGGREEGNTTAFTRLLFTSCKQRGFPKANAVTGQEIYYVKIKGSRVQAH